MTTVAHETSLRTRSLSALYRSRTAIENISIDFPSRATTALIGPSGAGKSTLLRCLNRIHELSRDASVRGQVLLDGKNIYAEEVRPLDIRRKVGMVFQHANPFPTMSILDNVTAGLVLRGQLKGKHRQLEVAERALRAAALWNEVKDHLETSGVALSGGQQQRLCIARAIAADPDVLLMDEPTSSLDPIATSQIEDLVQSLAKQYTIVIVTHNMQQATRVANHTAFMLGDESGIGRLIEFDTTNKLFTRPADKRTEDFVTGRFG